MVLSDAELDAIESRVLSASPGPWRAFVEGRDHWSGDDFIMVSEADGQPDMYVSRSDASGTWPASTPDLDFIAASRQDVPALLAEVRRLRAERG